MHFATMKKVLTIITLLFLALGWASAQNVYFSGNDNGTGKIWRNDTLIYSISDTVSVNLSAMRLAPDGSTYAAGYAHNTALTYIQGCVWHNDTLIFTAGANTAINALDFHDGTWTAGGVGENEWESISGLVWQNGALLHAYSDSTLSNQIMAVAVDPATGDVYSGGTSSELETQAALWKNDTLLWRDDSISTINALTLNGTDIYAAGSRYAEGYHAVLWKNDTVIFSINADDAEFSTIAFYNGSVYLGGYNGNSLYIWQDDEVLYDHACTSNSNIYALTVNEFGVYYAGQIDGVATVWKDGEILYQPEDCEVVNGLAVLAAPQPSYTLTVEVDSIGGGTVTGGGTYYYGDTATIEAIPELGYEFLYWNDSITDNPHDIVITQDSTFIAHFGQIDYTITTLVIPLNSGTVTEGGIYHYGDTLTLEAVANPGFEFERWNDSVTDNPRDIIVTQDSTFIAWFNTQQFTITVVSDNPEWGSVTGGGTYPYGDTIQIAATANLGYEFVRWEDGNTDNPRVIIVTEDQTFTAHFSIQRCLITTDVTPEGAGTVEGGGTYDYGTTIQLTAINNTGYEFSMWEDGDITNPRSILVEGDATFVAVLVPLQYEITTECEPVEGGTVSGAGTYDYGSVVALTATPNENYTFLCWSDGIVTNPREITVTADAHFKALFHLNGTPQYTITVTANEPGLGTVTGSGTYPEGTTIEISAIPNEDAVFTSWDDGNTENPRTIVVKKDMEFVAIFAKVETFTITVRPENAQHGTTYGSGIYPVNQEVTIGATPNEGFYFTGWQDGDMHNPRTIIVTGDAEYIASFSQNPVHTYTVTVYYDENQGFILGAGEYTEGSTASIAAIPADGYYFVKWSDGTTDNPKEVLVDHDIVLAAFFNGTGIEESGWEGVNLYPNPANDKIRIEGLEGEHEIQIYNAFGLLVMTTILEGDSEINICDLPAGYYLIRIDNRVMKFIKENK